MKILFLFQSSSVLSLDWFKPERQTFGVISGSVNEPVGDDFYSGFRTGSNVPVISNKIITSNPNLR